MFLESEADLILINLKDDEEEAKNIKIRVGECDLKSLDLNPYKIEGIDTELEFKTGAVYALLINNADKVSLAKIIDLIYKMLYLKKISKIELIKENTINILWMIPQNIALASGEIMISVTGLEFAYSQAPVTMKSFLQACWNLTTAFGNLLVVFITGFVKLNNPVRITINLFISNLTNQK